jgi:arabinose-5-phosphate isomerase
VFCFLFLFALLHLCIMSITDQEILQFAKATVAQEAEALKMMEAEFSTQFAEVIRKIVQTNARVVVTGIGKSGIIAQKWVATFNSTGQNAVFMHAADAIHGDLGMVTQEDIVFCISKSGESPEIRYLVPLIKEMGNLLVAVTANALGFLGKEGNFLLHTPMTKEACPNNLAPTTSTTLQLAMGDALAVALMKVREFGSADFAKFHPGGALGKRVALKVGDVMNASDDLLVHPETPMIEVISKVSQGRMGAVAIVRADGQVAGIITDGDIRRMIEKNPQFTSLKADDVMCKSPKSIAEDVLAVEAYRALESNSITQILVLEKGCWKGMVHLHDLLREGIF